MQDHPANTAAASHQRASTRRQRSAKCDTALPADSAQVAGSWQLLVQHQYEHAYWQPHDRWDFVRVALDGRSYCRLLRVLQWFTGNIGFRHIHYVQSRIPNYNLAPCYAAVPELRQAVTLGLRDSLKCARLKLWDEQLQRMVTFNEVHRGRT
ncbi:MAG: hypothetical protein U0805_15585 [Pirellulales bacterium]